ncbi:hypothetical protein R1flu_029221 [Riccia fluitans]|uniref:Uncharacterized protein n=1 Tax=Riccia fluitans TaxID=41844 RepID=A0ABD1XSZ8_9MARC
MSGGYKKEFTTFSAVLDSAQLLHGPTWDPKFFAGLSRIVRTTPPSQPADVAPAQLTFRFDLIPLARE